MPSLSSIYAHFKTLVMNQQKIDYLRELESYNLPYDINYTGLVKYYETNF